MNLAAEQTGCDAGDVVCVHIDCNAFRLSGKWVELAYEQPLTSRAVRPVVEFDGARGSRSILPAAVLGHAKWLGYVPRDVRAIRVLADAKALRISELRVWRTNQVWARALITRPWGALKAILSSLFKAHMAERLFRRALVSESLANYPRWRAERVRAPEWDGFDAPLGAPAAAILLIYVGERTPEASAAIERMRGYHPAFSVRFVTAYDARFVAEFLEGRDDHELVMCLRPEFTFADGAASIFATASARSRCDVFYSDEEIESRGQLAPLFKPDWSPVLAQSKDLVGFGWAARASWLRRHCGARRIIEVANQVLRPGLDDRVAHIARPLLRRTAITPLAREVFCPPRFTPTIDAPSASIVIPTHNRFDPCLSG